MLIDMSTDNLKLATDNLLFNCAGLKSGDSLLVVYENPDLGWYEKGLADVIAKAKNVALMASRTNTLLSIPMLFAMTAQGHGMLF